MENKLIWNVYATNLNSDRIVIRNVFNYNWVAIGKLYPLHNCKNKKMFEDILDNVLLSEYWLRFQYETYVLPPFSKGENSLKIDVYEQVRLNWKPFVDYCWKNKKLFKQFKSEYLEVKKLNKRIKEGLKLYGGEK